MVNRITRWMVSITVAIGVPLGVLKNQIGDTSSWRRSVYVVAKSQYFLDGM